MYLVEQGKRSSLEFVDLGLYLLGGSSAFASLVLGHILTERGNLLLNRIGFRLVEFVFKLLESLLGVVQDTVGTVGGFNGSLALFILRTVLLGVVNHALDFVVRKTGTGRDRDRLVLIGRLILSMDIDNRVGINIKGNLDLWNATVRRRNANQLEVTQELVIAYQLTLTLIHLNYDSSLDVGRSGDDLHWFLVFSALRFTVVMLRLGTLLHEMGVIPEPFGYDNAISDALDELLADA